ncbi:lipoyl(octanoyl) transferase LipB [Leucobacter luti]|uniref:Octanoyltransferase n=1 Tax=Leucobacter luti TaxID=340320 RepID=A0A4Q7TU14_9MICO|nr:lipoyl(octanoyl) transferase LipB [Leucobacter luti]MBL3698456.1 lipoyl(octanoyl) transferase LipB [Leucobacter luti]RZT64456.1 lipoyl(octanoyl) transferase [Leucobacter luti]
MRSLTDAPPATPHFVTAGFAPHTVPYRDGLALQRDAAERVRTRADRGTVFLLEHEAVYTAGRRATPDEYPRDGTPVVDVDRGGRVTWHGPGQLVAYPVIKLAPGVGVVDLVRGLEQVIIDAAAELGANGFRVAGRSGVWADDGGPAPAKFAQIGLHASDGIITHGLALNCSNDLTPFSGFVPCGITDAGVTSVSALAGRRVTPADAAPVLQERLAAALTEFAA